MFFHTDTADAPWTVIKSDDKKRARLNCSPLPSTLDYPNKDRKWFARRIRCWWQCSHVLEADETHIDRF